MTEVLEQRLSVYDTEISILNANIKELEKELEEKNKDIEWYKMWHNKFKKQIEDLQTELETYRPTKLEGNGQCSCHKCKEEGRAHINWTNWCYKYKGQIYCEDCLKEILEKEKNK